MTAPSAPPRAYFKKWSGLNCVESYLIVSSAVVEVLISTHLWDWLWVKCALMNTNLQHGLGLSGICWVSESSGQVIRLLQVYRRAFGSLGDACSEVQTLCFLQGEMWSITAGAMCVSLWIHMWSGAQLLLWICTQPHGYTQRGEVYHFVIRKVRLYLHCFLLWLCACQHKSNSFACHLFSFFSISVFPNMSPSHFACLSPSLCHTVTLCLSLVVTVYRTRLN